MENNQQQDSSTQGSKENSFEGFNQFLKRDFKNILMTFFKSPTDGIFYLFKKNSDKAFYSAKILFAYVFIIYFIGGLLLSLGTNIIEHPSIFKFLVVFGISPLLIMLLISCFSFIIKSSGDKANFKNELFTGGLCGIPLILQIPFLLLIKFLSNSDTLLDFEGLSFYIIGLFWLYSFLMIINVLCQSLKASGVKVSVAWYISPVAVLFSFVIAYNIANSFLSESSNNYANRGIIGYRAPSHRY